MVPISFVALGSYQSAWSNIWHILMLLWVTGNNFNVCRFHIVYHFQRLKSSVFHSLKKQLKRTAFSIISKRVKQASRSQNVICITSNFLGKLLRPHKHLWDFLFSIMGCMYNLFLCIHKHSKNYSISTKKTINIFVCIALT